MKEVILNDTHPGNHNDKIKVIICKYVQKDSDFTDEGLTGVRKTNEYCKGMFDEDTDPIQDIIYEDGEYHFTMSNITTISREQVDQLLKDGELHIQRKFEDIGDENDGKVYFDLKITVL